MRKTYGQTCSGTRIPSQLASRSRAALTCVRPPILLTAVLVATVLPEGYIDNWLVGNAAIKFPDLQAFRSEYIQKIEDGIEANPTLFPQPASAGDGIRPGVWLGCNSGWPWKCKEQYGAADCGRQALRVHY